MIPRVFCFVAAVAATVALWLAPLDGCLRAMALALMLPVFWGVLRGGEA